jgi:hypothetical protein
MSMTEFDYGSEAELFSSRGRISKPRARYRRFCPGGGCHPLRDRGAAAGASFGHLSRSRGGEIRRRRHPALYDDAAYPLARRAAPPRPTKPARRSKTVAFSHAVTPADKITNDTARVRETGRTEAINTSRHRGAT